MHSLQSLAGALLFFCMSLILGPGSLSAEEFPFGLLLVGPADDHGWSQAHYEAGKEIEKLLPGTKMICIDKVNPADRSDVTIPMLVTDLVSKGVRLIIANSEDMKDGILEASFKHPEIQFIHVSGDDAQSGRAGQNLSNLMGRMEYGKMMAGFSAAMTSKSGKIAYLGPLINAETRRMAVAAYLGARYAWTTVLKKSPEDLSFKVNWIGFWFNIPGVTSDPSLVASTLFDSGYDVIISGIDTTEALVVAGQHQKAGKEVYAVPYEYQGACAIAPDACLGVPYFNWVPGFRQLISSAMEGTWKQQFLWLGPRWTDINDTASSSVGFLPGQAMSEEVKSALIDFQVKLSKGLDLFTGPLSYQDGSPFLSEDVSATDEQIWNIPQLLEGMEGASQ